MHNFKKVMDKRKMEQIKRWNNSEINQENTNFRPKKVHFDSTTRFLDACINFYQDEINELLNFGIDVNCADKDNLTAIHQACINSRIDLVEYLLLKNANINVCDKEGWTPLHIAADIGSYELAKFLIDHGARLDIANHDGDLPAMLVDEKEYPDLKIYFQREMDRQNINIDACSNYERAVMLEDVKKWTFNKKYDPPIDKVYRSTPVHVAAAKNYVNILYQLLPLLTVDDINAQDVDGWTALHAAAHWGHKEACTLLILNGADIDIRTRANETVLDTVDPILKNELIEEIKKAQIEKEKNKNLNFKNEIILRTDAANKRRSSIARQSVEWKKNAQMKESVSERQTLIKASLNSESSGIITIEETDEKMSSPKDNIVENHIEIDNIYRTESLTDHKKSNIGKENLQISPVKCYQNFNENRIEVKNTEKRLLSNGDNCKNNASSIQITENLDLNNTLKINDLHGKDDLHSEENAVNNEIAVVIRPKSLRDEIISHRSTNSRLSVIMAPVQSEESEVSRREKARRVRSTRRSTQGIEADTIKEVDSRNNSEILKSGSFIPENPVQVSWKPINSDEISTFNNEKEIITIESQIDNDLKENTNSNEIIKNGKDLNKSGSFCDRSNLDSVDSDTVGKKNLKHQNSCPVSRQNEILSHDVARLNITNTISSLIRRKPYNVKRTLVSSVPVVSNPSVEKPTRGIDVNKFIESTDFSVNRETNSRFTFKNSDNQSDLKSESIEEKNNGSFIAKPVTRNSKKANTEYDDNLKIKHSQEIPNNQEKSNVAIYEHAEVSCSKDDNSISKTILTRMINDQTTKQELTKENESLKQKIKEHEDRIRQLEDNLRSNNQNVNCESDKLAKLENEKLKICEDNQRLKSQNEALLRVISRIQQELESLR